MSKPATGQRPKPLPPEFRKADVILTVYEGPMISQAPDLDGAEYGAYFDDYAAIVVASGQTPEDKRETVLHEVLHFLYRDHPDTMTDRQHAALTMMARWTLAFTDWLRSDRTTDPPSASEMLEEMEHPRRVARAKASDIFAGVPTPSLIAELKTRARRANPEESHLASVAVHRATQAMLDGAITRRTWKRYIGMILEPGTDDWHTVLDRLSTKAHWHG